MTGLLTPCRLHSLAGQFYNLSTALSIAVGCLAGTASAQPPPANRSWTIEAPPNVLLVSRGFGASVSISDNRLAIGAPGDYDYDTSLDALAQPKYGAVYVYEFDGSTWSLETKLRAPGLRPGDRFGAAVALDGGTLIVGAPGDDIVTDTNGNIIGSVTDRGAAHVFSGGDTWTYLGRLEPDLPAGDNGEGALFGSSVALSADYVVVGAPRYRMNGMVDAGGVWFRDLMGSPRSQTVRLTSASPPEGFASPGRRLGAAVATYATRHQFKGAVWLSNSSTTAGAPSASTGGEGSGAAVLWLGNIGFAGSSVLPITPPVEMGTAFGVSVSVVHPQAEYHEPGQTWLTSVVGAPGHTPAGGAVIVVSDGSLVPLAPSLPPNTPGGYGAAVAYLADGTVLVGAGNGSESLYAAPVAAFRTRADGTWAQAFTLPVAGMTGLGGHGFGSVMSAFGDLVAVASPTFPSVSTRPHGAVTIFDLATLDVDLDSLPDRWERQWGLDPSSATGDEGASGDPDGDGLTNAQEYEAQSHPRGRFVRYFAEGSTNRVGTGYFNTTYAVANPGATTINVAFTLLLPSGRVEPYYFQVSPRQTVTREVPPYGRGADASQFSAVVESDGPVVADREMRWFAPGGIPTPPTGPMSASHAERASEALSTTWYFAEGATHSGFDVFFLLANVGDAPNTVRATYLQPNAPPLEKDYTLPPHSRTTVWVDYEEFPSGSGQRLLASSDFGATFASLDGLGFIAERSMYLSRPDLPIPGGHASAGATSPATRWLFAEGATGALFDEFILLANPGATPAQVRLAFLLEDGRRFTKDVTVGAHARFNVWVDYESFDGGATFPLADVSHSTVVESLDGVGLVAERSMWWPGTGWREGHNAFGTTETGSAWMSALLRGSYSWGCCFDYLLVGNPNDSDVTIRLTLSGWQADPYSPTGERTWDYTLTPQSRLTIPVNALGVNLVYPASPPRIEVLGDSPPGIFVEQASYDNYFHGGNCRLLTKIRE